VSLAGNVARYVVREELGRGGMGRVLRAHDPELGRDVALKEVHREALGIAGAQRLFGEARALAKLSHPHVVAVYDVLAVEPERVVLVMEYVPGQSLTQWLSAPRSWQEVVACFLQAGRGLAAAHAAGLLHRDFKPDNVLVGADGRVRVTDFGLAREVRVETTDELLRDLGASQSITLATVPGAVAGTLPYLAPERLMGGAADVASDQFAFCVSLWEALLGRRPFPGQTVVELAFSMSAGPPRPPAGAPRVPAWLLQATTRGLASDASSRWRSMDALLRVLDRDPAARRRRWALALSGVATLGLCAGAVQALPDTEVERCSEAAATLHLRSAWDDRRRADVRDAVLAIGAGYAHEVWARTEHTLDTYARAWTGMHVQACEATTVHGEQSPAVMDMRMACLRRASVELSAVTEALAKADANTVERAHELTASLRPLERCADLDALRADVEPPLPEQAAGVEEVRGSLARARAALSTGRYDDAEQAVDAARARRDELGYGPLEAEVAIVHALVLDARGDYEAAHLELRTALRSASTWHQTGEMRSAALHLVRVAGYRLQEFDEARRHAELARALGDGDPEHEARVRSALATVLDAEGDPEAAEAELRRALALREARLAPDHPDLVETHGNLAAVLHARGKYDEAEAANRRVLALREDILGRDHPHVALTRHNLALTLHASGRLEEAEHEHRRALAVWEASLGPEHPTLATARNDLAAVLQARGNAPEAETEHRRALAILEAALSPDHVDVASCRNDLAIALATQGELEAAEAQLRRAIPTLEAALGPEHPLVAQSLHNLGNILEDEGEHEDAIALHRRALSALETALGPEHPRVASARTGLAMLLLDRGAIGEARKLAEAAWAQRNGDDTPPAQRGRTAFVLARASWENGDRDARRAAIVLAEAAAADFAGAGEAHEGDTAEVESWLADRREPSVVRR
jgi:tetratricopeptide (TPR) repeat protein